VNIFVCRRVYFYWIVICGLAIILLFHYGFASRYSLNEYGARPRQSIGTLTDFSNEGAYWYIGSMALLFVLYGLGYSKGIQPIRRCSPSQQRWALGLVIVGGAAFSLILISMYPVDGSDVYDYIIRGRMSALYGLNPLENVPNQIVTDPFYRFASWHRTPSAYGPAWELLAHTVSTLTATSSRNQQVIAYKLMAIAGYGLTALFVGLTLRRVAPRRLLIGLYLFMWNPLVVYMTAGTGHNDALMAACIALALYCLSRRWYVAATLGATIGLLTKFIPVLLIPIIALVALRDLGTRRWLRYMLFSVLLSGALIVIMYAPYWHGWDTLRTERRALLYTGSVATVARQWLMPILDGTSDLTTSARNTPNSRALLANGTVILFGIAYLSQLVILLQNRQPVTTLRTAARIMLAYLLIASIWFHAWYVIWLIALVALLEDTPLRRLALVFSYLVTWQAFLYNYMSIQTRSDQLLPWLDLVPVTIYMGCTWGYIVWYQISRRLRGQQSHPADRAIGERLQAARGTVGLTLSDLSDELAIRYDYLEQYERGERSLRLDHGRALAQRLNLSLDDLLSVKA